MSDWIGGGNLTCAGTRSQDNQLTARFLHFSLNPLIHLIWFWDSIYIVYCLLADLLAAGLFTEQLIDPNPGTQLHFTVFSKSSTEKHSDMLTSAVGAFSARRASRPKPSQQSAGKQAGWQAGRSLFHLRHFHSSAFSHRYPALGHRLCNWRAAAALGCCWSWLQHAPEPGPPAD